MILTRLWPYIAGALVVLIIICVMWLGWTPASDRADDLQEQLTVQTARADTAERKVNAMVQADAERAMDETKLDQMKDDLTNAIDAAPKDKPDAAGVSLACERLRRAGLTASADYRRVCGG